MLGIVKGLLHKPAERLRPVVFNFRANESNEIGITGIHVLNS